MKPAAFARAVLRALVTAISISGFAVASEPAPPAPIADPRVEAAVARASALLERWIINSRATALSQGVAPMPASIRDALQGFFPPARLEKVRYRVGVNPDWSLQANLFAIQANKAITLNDIIVFRDAKTAADLRIWAHELAHIEQYERWGIAGFSRRYLLDFRQIEADAWTVADRYEAWRRERSTAAPLAGGGSR